MRECQFFVNKPLLKLTSLIVYQFVTVEYCTALKCLDSLSYFHHSLVLDSH